MMKYQYYREYRHTLGKKKNLGFQILAFSTDYGDSIAEILRKAKNLLLHLPHLFPISDIYLLTSEQRRPISLHDLLAIFACDCRFFSSPYEHIALVGEFGKFLSWSPTVAIPEHHSIIDPYEVAPDYFCPRDLRRSRFKREEVSLLGRDVIKSIITVIVEEYESLSAGGVFDGSYEESPLIICEGDEALLYCWGIHRDNLKCGTKIEISCSISQYQDTSAKRGFIRKNSDNSISWRKS